MVALSRSPRTPAARPRRSPSPMARLWAAAAPALPLELRRGMRGRPVQRAGGGLGRGAGNPHRRVRHAGRGGVSEEVAYMECVGELKLIAELIEARGIAGMREAISNTAELGAVSAGRASSMTACAKDGERCWRKSAPGASRHAARSKRTSAYPRLRAARRGAGRLGGRTGTQNLIGLADDLRRLGDPLADRGALDVGRCSRRWVSAASDRKQRVPARPPRQRGARNSSCHIRSWPVSREA